MIIILICLCAWWVMTIGYASAIAFAARMDDDPFATNLATGAARAGSSNNLNGELLVEPPGAAASPAGSRPDFNFSQRRAAMFRIRTGLFPVDSTLRTRHSSLE